MNPRPELFWAKVKKTPSCWIWQGALDSKGYGILTRQGRNYRAHRFAYGLANGFLAEGDCSGERVLRHSCNNRRCVNPEHLSLGTQADNAHDTVLSGNSTAGERHAMVKVSAEIVAAIRRDYIPGTILQRHLAARYGISQSQVSNIIRGYRWKKVVS